MASNSGGAKVAAIILALVGVANIGYGVFRISNGQELSPPLFGVGAMAFILGGVLYSRAKKSGK